MWSDLAMLRHYAWVGDRRNLDSATNRAPLDAVILSVAITKIIPTTRKSPERVIDSGKTILSPTHTRISRDSVSAAEVFSIRHAENARRQSQNLHVKLCSALPQDLLVPPINYIMPRLSAPKNKYINFHREHSPCVFQCNRAFIRSLSLSVNMANDKSLSESAKSNPTALGDPVSLKAEKSDASPTEKDRPNQPPQQPALRGHQQGIKQLAPAPTEDDVDGSTQPRMASVAQPKDQSTEDAKAESNDKDKKSIKELAQQDLKSAKEGNKSMLGDPTSLKAETSERDPVKGGEEDGTGRSGATPGKGRDTKL